MRPSVRIGWVAMVAAALLACDSGTITGGDHGDGAPDDAAASPDGAGHADASATDASPEPPTTTVTFTEAEGDVINPERGFYSAAALIGADDLSWVRESDGNSLLMAYVRLDDYRDRPLDSALLTALEDSFDVVRSAGLELVLRFSYNFGPYPDSEPDAPLAQVLEHIGQLGPIVTDHKDVVAALQAGFIGAWGEWHTSTNDLTTPENKAAILSALLDAIPEDRMVQLRYPPDMMGAYPTALDDSTGFTGSDQARVGHHNDCFLSSDNDVGTYGREEASMAEEQAYLANASHYVPLGGETCAVYPPRSDCPTALDELERLGFSYLNEDYHQDVIAGWQDQGCYDEIRRRLGYRLVLTRATHSERVRPGGILQLAVEIENRGFAALFNPRPLLVVLSNAGARYEVELADVDLRRFAAGETSSIETRLRLPADIAPGAYELALWMPPPSSQLRDRPEYAIQLANNGTWSADGRNILVADLAVDADAPGDFDPGATDLEVLP